jgi:hypothetical protein
MYILMDLTYMKFHDLNAVYLHPVTYSIKMCPIKIFYILYNFCTWSRKYKILNQDLQI